MFGVLLLVVLVVLVVLVLLVLLVLLVVLLVLRTCSVFRLAPAAEFCHTGCERTVSQQLTLQQLVCTMSECDP